MLYGLNDMCIIPATISDIESRSECNPYYDSYMLPLFTAPMSCIVDDKNYIKFAEQGVYSIIPRNISLEKRYELMNETFVAMSLEEFESSFCKEKIFTRNVNFVCVDIANGHMKKLLDLCKKAKELHGDLLQLMTGNIANPETYLEYAKVGIDYVRVGIGSGNVCTTSANGGIHYPMASLIQKCIQIRDKIISFQNSESVIREKIKINEECINSMKESRAPYDFYKDIIKYDLELKYELQNELDEILKHKSLSMPKIVADGGFKNFDQIIKALALGADYCMLGEIFAKSWEACGQIFMHTDSDNPMINDTYLNSFKDKCKWVNLIDRPELGLCVPHREYYGMSTKRAQQEFGKTDLKTAEGIIKQVTIDYTLEGWLKNFIHYLTSAMSYTNSRNLKEFSNCNVEWITPNSFQAYHK